jgi:hypothetical protein
MKNKHLVNGLKAGFLCLVIYFLLLEFLFKNSFKMTYIAVFPAVWPLSLFFSFIMFLIVWRTEGFFTKPEEDEIEKFSKSTIHKELKILELKKKDEECEGK